MTFEIDGSKRGMHYITYPEIRPYEYLITNQGVVIDCVKRSIVRYQLDKDGYMRVDLRSTRPPKHGKYRYLRVGVHRLVAWEFCENDDPTTKNVVNHLDTKILHNESKNLEWTDVAGNTRHAEATGVRNVSGANNGNAVYSEEFVRKICSLYQDGLEPIDVYHELYSTDAIKTVEDANFYRFLYGIKTGRSWTKVAADYTFERSVAADPSKKIFAPKDSSRFNEAQVHWICKKFQDGYGIQDVLHMIRAGEMDGYSPRFDSDKAEVDSLKDGLGRIARGRTWKHIVKDYDFSNRAYATNPNQTYMYESFQTLIDAGKTKHAIVEIVSKNFNRQPGYIRGAFNRYLREHGYEVVYGGYKKAE